MAPKSFKNCYEILALPTECTENEIKKAYRHLALLFHPDKAAPEKQRAATAKFQLINEAYEILSQPRLRRVYDEDFRKHFAKRSQEQHSHDDVKKSPRREEPFWKQDNHDDAEERSSEEDSDDDSEEGFSFGGSFWDQDIFQKQGRRDEPENPLWPPELKESVWSYEDFGEGFWKHNFEDPEALYASKQKKQSACHPNSKNNPKPKQPEWRHATCEDTTTDDKSITTDEYSETSKPHTGCNRPRAPRSKAKFVKFDVRSDVLHSGLEFCPVHDFQHEDNSLDDHAIDLDECVFLERAHNKRSKKSATTGKRLWTKSIGPEKTQHRATPISDRACASLTPSVDHQCLKGIEKKDKKIAKVMVEAERVIQAGTSSLKQMARAKKIMMEQRDKCTKGYKGFMKEKRNERQEKTCS